MPPVLRVFFLTGCAMVLASCAARRLPPYENPLPRAQFQNVRTTAYTHTESDHLPHGRMTARGTRLKSGAINSAAADWSRWPAGTIFRIVATGEIYEIDDYGWALSGRNTIDLYRPTRMAMIRWGVRHATIEILQWGDTMESYRILRPRRKYPHVHRMLEQIERRHR